MSDRDEGLEHAWAWFSHHSQQRFVTMNFFIVIGGAIMAGAAALLKDGQQLACAFLGGSQSILSVVFFLMDRRARRLIKIGEDALEAFQDQLSVRVKTPELNLVRRSNVKTSYELSYSKLLIAMYLVFFIAGLVLTFNVQLLPLVSMARPVPASGDAGTRPREGQASKPAPVTAKKPV